MSEQKSYTEWLEAKNAELSDRVARLDDCCARRDQAMQRLRRALEYAMQNKGKVPGLLYDNVVDMFDSKGRVERCR